MRRTSVVCALGLVALGLAPGPVRATACVLKATADAAGASARLPNGKTLLQPVVLDDCTSVKLEAGTAVAQYFNKAGELVVAVLRAGVANPLPNLDVASGPMKTVGRSMMSILTDAPERMVAGKKFFDKPAQVGAPFGDVYVPREGLPVRFTNLEGEARVQIFDGATLVLESIAAQGVTLERARLRPGVKYDVRITTKRGKLPDGAFEVVAQDLQAELDAAWVNVERDERLDASMRAVGKALLMEREGLSFNREVVLRELKK